MESEIPRVNMLRRHLDLAVILILTALLLASIYLQASLYIRVPLGFIYVMFIPGYAMTTCIFPRRSILDAIERLALSVVLSIVTISLIVILLNFTAWSISLESVLFILSLLIILCCVLSVRLRGNHDSHDQLVLSFSMRKLRAMGEGIVDRSLSLILTLSSVAAFTTLAFALTNVKVGERYTDFYILGWDGKDWKYPVEVSPNDTLELIVGTVNHEHRDESYRVEFVYGSERLDLAWINLADEELWERPFILPFPRLEGYQKLSFLLYLGNDQIPYRSLHLWIGVQNEGPFP